jgi:sRNA-binding carbon storage regulator CsrA
MLVISRNDGESILLHVGKKTAKLTVRADEDLRIFRGTRKIVSLEAPQDSEWFDVFGYSVRVMLVRFRGFDSVTIGIEADGEVIIARDDKR